MYREAVATSSPGLPSRLPWVSNSNPPQPRWGCVLFHPTNPNVTAEPATLGWRSKPLRGISHAMHSAAFLSIMGDF
jgi:hypothetical protein